MYWVMVLAKRPVVAVMVVALKPLERAREPEKELEPVPETVNCFVTVSQPAKELEAVPKVETINPPVVRLPVE